VGGVFDIMKNVRRKISRVRFKTCERKKIEKIQNKKYFFGKD